MDLTQQDANDIRAFLRYCLNDGYYAFGIGGEIYTLDSNEDIDIITEAIKKASPPVKQYRLNQAKRGLEVFQLNRVPA